MNGLKSILNFTGGQCRCSRIRISNGNLYLDSIEIVHSKDGTLLVLIADKTEALGFPSLSISRQVDVHYLAIPTKQNTASR